MQNKQIKLILLFAGLLAVHGLFSPPLLAADASLDCVFISAGGAVDMRDTDNTLYLHTICGGGIIGQIIRADGRIVVDLGEIYAFTPLTAGEGPLLTLTALLQGYYNPAADLQRAANVEVEVRSDLLTPVGDSEGKPYRAVILLDDKGIGSIKISNSKGEPLPDGNYFLVIRHANHLPVITAKKISLPGSLDLSKDINLVHKKDDSSEYGAPMFLESNNKYVLKGGYLSAADNEIGLNDYNILGNPDNWQKTTANAADPAADIDGNGSIGISDYNIMGNPKIWKTRHSVP